MVKKEGNVLHLLSPLDAIPDGQVFQINSSPNSVGGDASHSDENASFSQIGMFSFFETNDDAGINWEDYFEIK
jgi:hypothetical protein